jgi:hypothetical protein
MRYMLAMLAVGLVIVLVGIGVPSPKVAQAWLIADTAVIDFSQQGAERVTIKVRMDGAPSSNSVADFAVRVIITDKRNGAQHDSGEFAPTTVR